jgi:hypothetical protein
MISAAFMTSLQPLREKLHGNIHRSSLALRSQDRPRLCWTSTPQSGRSDGIAAGHAGSNQNNTAKCYNIKSIDPANTTLTEWTLETLKAERAKIKAAVGIDQDKTKR